MTVFVNRKVDHCDHEKVYHRGVKNLSSLSGPFSK